MFEDIEECESDIILFEKDINHKLIDNNDSCKER